MYLTEITSVYKDRTGGRWLDTGEFNPNGEYWVGDVMSADKKRYEIKLTFLDYLRMANRKKENLKKRTETHRDVVDVENGVVDVFV